MVKREKDLLKPLREYLLYMEGLVTGPLINRNGMQVAKDEVQVILRAQTLDSTGAASSFLGYANFYRRFNCYFVAKAIPLYEQTKKDVKFIWTKECEEAFHQMKAMVWPESQI